MTLSDRLYYHSLVQITNTMRLDAYLADKHYARHMSQNKDLILQNY